MVKQKILHKILKATKSIERTMHSQDLRLIGKGAVQEIRVLSQLSVMAFLRQSTKESIGKFRLFSEINELNPAPLQASVKKKNVFSRNVLYIYWFYS